MTSYTDAAGSAEVAGLRYVSDAAPGIKRARAGSAFRYFFPDGKPVRDRETLARIKALAIPPAWQDRKLAAIVRRMRDLPGYELFQYIDERGEIRAVDSADVNAYLKRIAGEEFTSKDFRTWAGTVLAAEALRRLGKKGLSQAVDHVARQLGNTRAVCRKCYIHPAIIEAHADGSLAQAMTGANIEACVKRLLSLRPKARSLLPLLRKSLRRLRRCGTQLAGPTAYPLR